MLSLPQENSAGLIQDISRNVSISLLYLHEVTSILHHLPSPSTLHPNSNLKIAITTSPLLASSMRPSKWIQIKSNIIGPNVNLNAP